MLASTEGAFNDIYLGQKKWYIYRQFEPWDWVIAYAVPLDVKYGDARVFRNTLIVIMGATGLFVLLMLSLIVTRFTHPIVKLTEASRQIAGGELDQKIDLSRNDELGELAHNFENMRSAIRNQMSELNREIRDRKRAEEKLK